MATHRVVSFVLVATLVAGCATHRALAPADGPVPAIDDETGSIAANVWYAPGRVLLCGLSAILAGLVMTVTMGQSYDDASVLMHGGCSGPWVVRPSDNR